MILLTYLNPRYRNEALFLIFHGLNPANGISKKIYYQVNALRACGIDTRLCYLNEPNGGN